MYIINQSKHSPEMYEVIFSSTLEMQRWAQVMRTASEKCPAEGRLFHFLFNFYINPHSDKSAEELSKTL